MPYRCIARRTTRAFAPNRLRSKSLRSRNRAPIGGHPGPRRRPRDTPATRSRRWCTRPWTAAHADPAGDDLVPSDEAGKMGSPGGVRRCPRHGSQPVAIEIPDRPAARPGLPLVPLGREQLVEATGPALDHQRMAIAPALDRRASVEWVRPWIALVLVEEAERDLLVVPADGRERDAVRRWPEVGMQIGVRRVRGSEPRVAHLVDGELIDPRVPDVGARQDRAVGARNLRGERDRPEWQQRGEHRDGRERPRGSALHARSIGSAHADA